MAITLGLYVGAFFFVGPIYKLRLGTKLVVVITSPSLARQVLKDHDVIFANHDVPVAALATTYGGSDIAWTPYGPEWRILRKQAGPAKGRVLLRPGRVVGERGGADVSEHTERGYQDAVGRNCEGGGAGLGREFREVISEITELLAKPNVSDFYSGLARFDLQGLVKQMEGIVKRFDAIFGKVIDTQLRVEKEGDKDEGSKDFLDVGRRGSSMVGV
ncbi:PREDICTED: cytochrome P450 93A3-like [Fragaria vesca subsp. vesca]